MCSLHAVLVLFVAPLGFRRLLDASPCGNSSSSGRRVADGDGIKTYNKWRMLLEPLAKEVKGFKCKVSKIEAALCLLFVLMSVITV